MFIDGKLLPFLPFSSLVMSADYTFNFLLHFVFSFGWMESAT